MKNFTRKSAILLTVLLFSSFSFAERIALVAAYQGELDAILNFIPNEQIEEVRVINGVSFTLASAYGKKLLIFKTNVSTVNAAMTTQLALSNFKVDTLLFSGVAGGINPELEKGDIAIPKQWVYHAESAYLNETSPGSDQYIMPKHSISRLVDGNFGMHHPRNVSATRGGMTNVIAKRSFDADADLLRVVQKAIEGLRKDSPKALLNAQGKPAIVKIGGTGVAGPIFMDNAEYRKFVYKTWQADSLDMESTAVAHVCWSNNVPFIIIRALSDLAGGQEGENDFSEFAEKAEKNAAQVMAALLQHL